MERAVPRQWLARGAYAGMFVFGIVMALLGAVLPVVSARIRFDLAQAGALFLAMNFAMLVSMLGLGPLMDRYGQKPPLTGGALLVAAALVVLANAADYHALVAAVVLLGAGGGALNGATNTLIADLHADPRRKNAALNLLGVFFGFGALFLPFVIGALLERLGLASILYAAAALSATLGAALWTLVFPPPKIAGRLPLAETARLARNPLVLLFGFLLFFESGNEFILGGYTSTYLTRELNIPTSASLYLLAAYWAAIMAARVVLSRVLLRVRGTALVMASALATAVGVLVLLAAHSEIAAAAGVVLVGVSLAGIYPTVLGQAGSRFADHSGTVFGILFAIALTGGMLLPWAVGQVAASHGLRTGLLIAAADALMIFALQWILVRAGARTAQPTAA